MKKGREVRGGPQTEQLGCGPARLRGVRLAPRDPPPRTPAFQTARTVTATVGLAGGTQIATREPSSRRASTIGELAGSRPRGRAMWMAARRRADSSRSGASCAVNLPARSTQTLPGPLIMISLTSESSRALSNPGRNGFRCSSPLEALIFDLLLSLSNRNVPGADSGA